MEEIYSVRLSKFSAFRGDDIYLNSVDLDIKKGEVVFFLGKNGCGKSTVLSLFRVNRDGDTAKFLGEFNVIKEKECFNIVKSDWGKPEDRNFYFSNIAYLDQSDLIQKYTTIERVMRNPTDFALKTLFDKNIIDKTAFMEKKQKIDNLVKECLSEFHKSTQNFGEKHDKKQVKYATKLSAGQKRLVCFFRTYIMAAVLESEVMVLDEPLNYLDCKFKQLIDNRLTALIAEREKKGNSITIIIVSHCLSLSLINNKNCKQYAFKDGGLKLLKGKKFYPCIEDADYLED